MIYLLALFALLNLADAWTTWQVLRFGGKELNPVITKLMVSLGTYQALLAIKVGMVAGAWYWALHGMSLFVLAGADVVYIAVVAWNYLQLQKQKVQ